MIFVEINVIDIILGVEDACMLTGDELNAASAYLVFLNGLIIGAHSNPAQFAEQVYYIICFQDELHRRIKDTSSTARWTNWRICISVS